MIIPYKDKSPRIASTAFVAPGAWVIGDVTLGEESSIWFGSIVRGDIHHIRIGRRTNIQDGSILHVTHGTYPVIVGDEVLVGHGVILHGCRIGAGCLIGIRAVVLDGCEIGDESIVAAGAVVLEGTSCPPRSLLAGVPARIKRGVTSEEVQRTRTAAGFYVGWSAEYRGLKEGGRG